MRRLKEITDQSLARIHRLEQRFHIWPASKEYFFHLSEVTQAWLQGSDFAKLGSYAQVDEGELVRYFRMALQVLREIQYAPVTSPALKEKIHQVVQVFNRDIVDAEKQLRMK